MAQVLIRNLDASVLASLKQQAADRRSSLEQYLRDILTERAGADQASRLERLRAVREQMGEFDLDYDVTAAIREDRDTR